MPSQVQATFRSRQRRDGFEQCDEEDLWLCPIEDRHGLICHVKACSRGSQLAIISSVSSPPAAISYEKSPDVSMCDAWSTSLGARLHNANSNYRVAPSHRSTHSTSSASITSGLFADRSITGPLPANGHAVRRARAARTGRKSILHGGSRPHTRFLKKEAQWLEEAASGRGPLRELRYSEPGRELMASRLSVYNKFFALGREAMESADKAKTRAECFSKLRKKYEKAVVAYGSLFSKALQNPVQSKWELTLG